jgi:hypothetical protein
VARIKLCERCAFVERSLSNRSATYRRHWPQDSRVPTSLVRGQDEYPIDADRLRVRMLTSLCSACNEKLMRGSDRNAATGCSAPLCCRNRLETFIRGGWSVRQIRKPVLGLVPIINGHGSPFPVAKSPWQDCPRSVSGPAAIWCPNQTLYLPERRPRSGLSCRQIVSAVLICCCAVSCSSNCISVACGSNRVRASALHVFTFHFNARGLET